MLIKGCVSALRGCIWKTIQPRHSFILQLLNKNIYKRSSFYVSEAFDWSSSMRWLAGWIASRTMFFDLRTHWVWQSDSMVGNASPIILDEHLSLSPNRKRVKYQHDKFVINTEENSSECWSDSCILQLLTKNIYKSSSFYTSVAFARLEQFKYTSDCSSIDYATYRPSRVGCVARGSRWRTLRSCATRRDSRGAGRVVPRSWTGTCPGPPSVATPHHWRHRPGTPPG